MAGAATRLHKCRGHEFEIRQSNTRYHGRKQVCIFSRSSILDFSLAHRQPQDRCNIGLWSLALGFPALGDREKQRKLHVVSEKHDSVAHFK
jgi:hypothetical protein